MFTTVTAPIGTVTASYKPRSFSLNGQAMTAPTSPTFQLNMVLRLASLIAVALIAMLMIDLSDVWIRVGAVSMPVLAAMIALQILIILLVSWRFALVTRASGAIIDMRAATRLTFVATLANMLLPTSLAGDAGRVLLVRNHGLTLKAAMGAGIFDRVIGLASLGAIVLVGAFAAPSIVPWPAILGLCLISAGIGLVVIIRTRRTDPNTPKRPAFVAAAVALSFLAHLMAIAIAALFLQDQGANVSSAQLFVLFPAVILAASIPISVGGWGTRELAAAAAFSTIGLAVPTAVALAFLFGVTQVVAAGLGTVLFTLLLRRDPAA